MQDRCAILQKAGGGNLYKLLIFKGIIDKWQLCEEPLNHWRYRAAEYRRPASPLYNELINKLAEHVK